MFNESLSALHPVDRIFTVRYNPRMRVTATNITNFSRLYRPDTGDNAYVLWKNATVNEIMFAHHRTKNGQIYGRTSMTVPEQDITEFISRVSSVIAHSEADSSSVPTPELILGSDSEPLITAHIIDKNNQLTLCFAGRNVEPMAAGSATELRVPVAIWNHIHPEMHTLETNNHVSSLRPWDRKIGPLRNTVNDQLQATMNHGPLRQTLLQPRNEP